MATDTGAKKLISGEDLQKIDTKKVKLEVLFPGVFTPEHPSPAENPRFFYPKKETIPIFRLSHITHKQEAKSIKACTSNSSAFVPRMKLAKTLEWDSSPPGATYKKVGASLFEIIPYSWDSPVFPGNLSWWGIDTPYWYNETEEGAALYERIEKNKGSGKYAPSFLASEPESPYGTKAFSMKLEDLFKDYKSSRSDSQREICLKVGGTLRYPFEICYVVIVCMENDDVGGMPNITETNLFNPNGLVDQQGIVVNTKAIPEFTIQSIVKTKETTHYDWEQLVFGFYYPAPMLKCRDPEPLEYDVAHDPPKCTSTVRPVRRGPGVKWVCPNKS